MKVYIQLAAEFNLPERMPSQSTLDAAGAPDFRGECEKRGIVITDYYIREEMNDYKDNVVEFWTGYFKNLKPGVTEILIHASSESEEIRAITGTASKRIKELEFFTSPELKKLLEKEGIILIGYRPLLELQRKKQ